MRCEFLVWKVPWVVQLHDSIPIEEDKRRRRADAEAAEVLGAHRHAHPRRDGIGFLVGTRKIGEFLLGCGVLPTSHIPIQLRGSDHDETAIAVESLTSSTV